jgi:hypothetical protein
MDSEYALLGNEHRSVVKMYRDAYDEALSDYESSSFATIKQMHLESSNEYKWKLVESIADQDDFLDDSAEFQVKINELNASPVKVLAHKVAITYKINNPFHNNATQEITKTFILSPDRMQIVGEI